MIYQPAQLLTKCVNCIGISTECSTTCRLDRHSIANLMFFQVLLNLYTHTLLNLQTIADQRSIIKCSDDPSHQCFRERFWHTPMFGQPTKEDKWNCPNPKRAISCSFDFSTTQKSRSIFKSSPTIVNCHLSFHSISSSLASFIAVSLVWNEKWYPQQLSTLSKSIALRRRFKKFCLYTLHWMKRKIMRHEVAVAIGRSAPRVIMMH